MRLVGEITPDTVKHSATIDNDDTNRGPEKAIDLDLGTRSETVPGPDETSWFQAEFEEVGILFSAIMFFDITFIYWGGIASDLQLYR